jgi:hypothetical protein
MVLTEEVLIGIAGIAITLIGFSGVVTALGRGKAGLWSPQELLQLRTLVEPSIVSLFSAFVPLVLRTVIESDELVWKISIGACITANAVAMTAFQLRGATDGIHPSHKIGSAIAVIVLAAMFVGLFSPPEWAQLTFFLGMLLGIGVSAHNFYLLLFPASKRPD